MKKNNGIVQNDTFIYRLRNPLPRLLYVSEHDICFCVIFDITTAYVIISTKMPFTTYQFPNIALEWTDVTHPTKDELKAISEKFGLHDYTMVDCLEPDHLPKYEEHNDIHFVLTRILAIPHDHAHTIQELSSKIAIFYNDKFLITIHRTDQPFLEEIKSKYVDTGRVKSSNEIVTKIIWYVLHSYDKPVITLSEEVDIFESQLFLKSITPNLLERIYYLKRKAGLCKKLLMLTYEVINSIRTTQNDNPALQDVKDLHLKLITMYDQVQEDVTNLLNIYISLSAQKTNDVMKVLTIFSVFFMPLTFISGIYGMNFQFMPELRQKWGYPAALLTMLTVATFIYTWFRRKKWL